MFYKDCWDLVGEKVITEIMAFLNGGDMPAGWNNTNITLIPEVKKPVQVKELRLISLCNVLYKIISKVLANRLKAILPEIIFPSQSAFVLAGRGEGYAAIKLDMSKAYDKVVEWRFFVCHDGKDGV